MRRRYRLGSTGTCGIDRAVDQHGVAEHFGNDRRIGQPASGTDELPPVLLVDMRVPEASRRTGETLRDPGGVKRC